MTATDSTVCPANLKVGDRFLDLSGVEHAVTGTPVTLTDSEEVSVPTSRGPVLIASWRDVTKAAAPAPPQPRPPARLTPAAS